MNSCLFLSLIATIIIMKGSDRSTWMLGSQYSISLTPVCEMKCLGCELWHHSSTGQSIHSFDSLIKAGSFFSYFPNVNVYHLSCGDFESVSDLTVLLMFLKQENKQIKLWIHGGLDIDILLNIKAYIDDYVVYFPSVDSSEYQSIVGYHEFDVFKNLIQLLKNEGCHVSLHTPIESDRVFLIPYFCDFALDYHVSILFHYIKKELTKDERRHIHYFERRPYVHVLKVKNYDESFFCKMPISCTTFSRALKVSFFRSVFHRIRSYFQV